MNRRGGGRQEERKREREKKALSACEVYLNDPHLNKKKEEEEKFEALIKP